MPADQSDRKDVVRLSLRTAADVDAISAQDAMSFLPAPTIYGALRIAAQKEPDKPAIVQLMTVDDPPAILTFASYLELVERAGTLFRQVSGSEPPVVAVIAPYLSEALIAMWGGTVFGRYLPINPYLDLDHVVSILTAAKATVLVTATSKAGRGVWDKLDGIVARVPSLKRVFAIGGGISTDFLDELNRTDPDRHSLDELASVGEECAYFHTGGTTGAPKLVRHTHKGQLLQAWLSGIAMGSEADGVLGHAMPNFHVGGAIAFGLRSIVFRQALVTLTPDGFRNPKVVSNFWQLVDRYKITHITAAPTIAGAILAANGDGPATLKHFTVGGAQLPTELARQFDRRYGLQLREVWGQTEFHCILTAQYAGEAPPRIGSCGRAVPFHRVMSAILDGNRFVREARPNERGVLIASGPGLIPGFVDPGMNASLFVVNGPDDVVWGNTGDIGTVDEDGFVWIFGREKDVIIRGGHNIDSALIDDVLVSHPAVLHAAAIGKPCPLKGELPIAYVELRPNASATIEEIADFAQSRIQERAAVPVEIIQIDVMPLTAVGKVSKPNLRIDALMRVATELCSGCPVRIEQHSGKPVVIVQVTNASQRSEIEELFAPFTFARRIEIVEHRKSLPGSPGSETTGQNVAEMPANHGRMETSQ